MRHINEAPLGKKSAYVNTYSPELLFPIPRKLKRDEIGISEVLPFRGYDLWNAFELSWLNDKGKPLVATAEFLIPCESPNLIESKSFKLYLNSLNNSRFSSIEQVARILTQDLSAATGAQVEVKIFELSQSPSQFGQLQGNCLDHLDIECSVYLPQPSLLSASGDLTEESLHTHLLKSNCLVTGQPDWGSVEIHYQGKKINHEGLLKYIISLRDHNEFHEQCVERIFMDLKKYCNPLELSVYARYTRRGGLDINPYRSSQITLQGKNQGIPRNPRLVRQ